jgi:hypothetical protein
MLPQNPPQPSCSYFPLKLLSVGIQTSKLMIESLFIERDSVYKDAHSKADALFRWLRSGKVGPKP